MARGLWRVGIMLTRMPTHRAPAARPVAARRGYGSRWQRYRAWFLRRHPCCGDRGVPAEGPGLPHVDTALACGGGTGDSLCQRDRRVVMATVVDHIVPVIGPEDPTFFKPECHQSLCASCHSKKTRRENGVG